MRFESATHAVVWLYRVAQEGKSIPGQSIAQKVDQYGPECATRTCGRKAPPAVHHVKGRGSVPYCPRCGREWPIREEYVPTGMFIQGRSGRASPRVETAIDAAFLLSVLRLHPDAELFVQWVVMACRTRAQMAEDLAQKEPDAGWTVHKLRSAHERGERWIESELRWRGLLEEGEA